MSIFCIFFCGSSIKLLKFLHCRDAIGLRLVPLGIAIGCREALQ